MLNTNSIVAIHGIYEDAESTWKHTATSTVWLRDLLDYESLRVRVLIYSYEVNNQKAQHSDSVQEILPYAQTLLQHLFETRESSNTSRRPLIFVCHGVGGLILKRAILLSHQASSDAIDGLRSVYVSTSSILYLATPHLGIDPETQKRIDKKTKGQSVNNAFVRSLESRSVAIQSLNCDFMSIQERFQSSLFWEELKTTLGWKRVLYVEQNSAAPAWAQTERCGIHATHFDMCKFSKESDPGFSVVSGAIRRALSNALDTISRRWEAEDRQKASSISVSAQVPLQKWQTNEVESRALESNTSIRHFAIRRFQTTTQERIIDSAQTPAFLQCVTC